MNEFSSSGIQNVIIGILASIGLALLVREIICWYWKVNKIIETINSTNARLDNVVTFLTNIDLNICNELNRRNGAVGNIPQDTLIRQEINNQAGTQI